MSPEIVPCLSTQSSTILETVIWVFPKRVSQNADLGLREGDEKSTNHFFTLWSICQSWVWTQPLWTLLRHLELPAAKTVRLGLIGLTRPNEGLRRVMGFLGGRYGPAAPNLCLNTATNTACYLPESCMKRNKACNKHERRSQTNNQRPSASPRQPGSWRSPHVADVLVTGHSLGGGVAALLSALWRAAWRRMVRGRRLKTRRSPSRFQENQSKQASRIAVTFNQVLLLTGH